jgi:hypothetical protein
VFSVLKVLGAVSMFIGILCLYEGRNIIRKNYSKKIDENSLTTGIKVFGAIITILGGILVIF